MPIEHTLDPDDCGHVYRSAGQHLEVGLATRHRADGTPRLLFDVTVVFARSPQPELGYLRQLRIDFEICRDGQLPPHIGVLIGRDVWQAFQRRPATPGSEPWRSLPAVGDSSFSWNNQIVEVYDWAVILSWPVARVSPGLKIPFRNVAAECLATPAGSDCLINAQWPVYSRKGELLIDDGQRVSMFFPTRQRVNPVD